MEKLNFEQIKEILVANFSLEDFAYDEVPYPDTYSEEAIESQKRRDEWMKNNPNPAYGSKEYEEWSEKLEVNPSQYDIAKKEFLSKLGINWKEVEQYGGEDQGSTWYSVKYFPDHDVYIRVDGYYSSYNGTDFNGWDDDCKEVRPKQKTITVYE